MQLRQPRNFLYDPRLSANHRRRSALLSSVNPSQNRLSPKTSQGAKCVWLVINVGLFHMKPGLCSS